MQAWRWALAQLSRRLWVRASLYAVIGVAMALVAALFSPLVPDALAKPFGGGTVTGLLNVLATSLLAVATFSTAAMLTAYTNVSQGATPRAAALITSDSRAQSALSSFIGAFLYSVVAFSAVGTGYYANGGRAILFGTTLVMLGWVAITLLRWLDQLLSLAQVGHAVDKVEEAALSAIRGRFGASVDPAQWCEPPEGAMPAASGTVGYVRNVDVDALDDLARESGVRIWVTACPGVFVHAGVPLAYVAADRALTTADTKRLRGAFDVAGSRSFDQDPRFGFIVLGEIASKALSPGINDPGTAIDVIGTGVRLLTEWRAIRSRAEKEAPSDVRINPIRYDDLLDDVFRPIATDGASTLSVAIRLQKAFTALAADADGDEAVCADLHAAAKEALARSEKALEADFDKARLRGDHKA